MSKLQGLGSRYFSTRAAADADLVKKIAADAKYSKWTVHVFQIPQIVGLELPDDVQNRTVYGATGGAAVLGWQIATDSGFTGGKSNGKDKVQKTADEQLSAMSEDERFAVIAKAMMKTVEEVRAMFKTPLAEPAPAPTGKGGRK
jgi:hypothetical protein